MVSILDHCRPTPGCSASDGNERRATHPQGRFQPNGQGVYSAALAVRRPRHGILGGMPAAPLAPGVSTAGQPTPAALPDTAPPAYDDRRPPPRAGQGGRNPNPPTPPGTKIGGGRPGRRSCHVTLTLDDAEVVTCVLDPVDEPHRIHSGMDQVGVVHRWSNGRPIGVR